MPGIVPAILIKPMILLQEAGSYTGIEPSKPTIKFGTIIQQYETSPYQTTEIPVMFDSLDAETIQYGDVTYYLLDETKIILREILPL